MTTLTSPFASPIARLLAHKRALGIAYHREEAFFAEFERATIGWPDGVLSEAVVRHYLAGKSDGGRAKRKGRTYGTIVVDLERHTVIDVLDQHSSEAVEHWLVAHPDIQTERSLK